MESAHDHKYADICSLTGSTETKVAMRTDEEKAEGANARSAEVGLGTEMIVEQNNMMVGCDNLTLVARRYQLDSRGDSERWVWLLAEAAHNVDKRGSQEVLVVDNRRQPDEEFVAVAQETEKMGTWKVVASHRQTL